MKFSVFSATTILLASSVAFADNCPTQKVSLNDLSELQSKVCTSVDALQSNIQKGNRTQACLEIGKVSAQSGRLEDLARSYEEQSTKTDKKTGPILVPSAVINTDVAGLIQSHYCSDGPLHLMGNYLKKQSDELVANCKYLKAGLLGQPITVDANPPTESPNHNN